MTKFESYLLEFQEHEQYSTSRVTPISREKCIELLKTKAYKAADLYSSKSRYIERSAMSAEKIKYGFLDASKMKPRLSRNTENYYTLIMNDDPIWSAWPKRQVIASYVIGKHKSVATLFNIFPFDKTKIGFCSYEDLWLSWKELKSFPGHISADEMNQIIENCIKKTDSAVGGIDDSLENFKASCKNFDNWFKGMKADAKGNAEKESSLLRISVQMIKPYMGITKNYMYFLDQYYKGDLYQACKKIYNPAGFKLGYIWNTSAKDDSEVWFDGPAVFINSQSIEDIIQEIFGNE